jgi:hypothetical protein
LKRKASRNVHPSQGFAPPVITRYPPPPNYQNGSPANYPMQQYPQAMQPGVQPGMDSYGQYGPPMPAPLQSPGYPQQDMRWSVPPQFAPQQTSLQTPYPDGPTPPLLVPYQAYPKQQAAYQQGHPQVPPSPLVIPNGNSQAMCHQNGEQYPSPMTANGPMSPEASVIPSSKGALRKDTWTDPNPPSKKIAEGCTVIDSDGKGIRAASSGKSVPTESSSHEVDYEELLLLNQPDGVHHYGGTDPKLVERPLPAVSGDGDEVPCSPKSGSDGYVQSKYIQAGNLASLLPNIQHTDDIDTFANDPIFCAIGEHRPCSQSREVTPERSPPKPRTPLEDVRRPRVESRPTSPVRNSSSKNGRPQNQEHSEQRSAPPKKKWSLTDYTKRVMKGEIVFENGERKSRTRSRSPTLRDRYLLCTFYPSTIDRS